MCIYNPISSASWTGSSPLLVPHLRFSTPKTEANNFDIIQTSAHLQTSLSETLNLLYPFSGRVRDNIYIDCFDEGVPFVEARDLLAMSEFFEHPEIEESNKFISCCSFSKEPGDEVPLLAFK